MMSKSLKVLTIGDTSTTLFITWRLFVANCLVIPAIPHIGTTINWKSKHLGDFTHKPPLIINNYPSLKQTLLENKVSFDFILISPPTHNFLKYICNTIKPLLSKDTIILIDSANSISLEAKIHEYLPTNPIISIVCDADLRKINGNTYVLKNSEVSTTFGFSGSSKHCNASTLDTLIGTGITGNNLKSLVSILQTKGVKPCSIISPKEEMKLASLIWKRMLGAVCFEIISIIFEEPKASALSNNFLSAPIIKGVFNELLNIAKSTGIKDLPDPNTDASKKLLDEYILNYDLKYPNDKESTSNDLPFIHAPKLYFDFSQSHSTNIELTLMQLLQLSDTYEIKCAYLISLYSYILRLITIHSGLDSNNKKKISVFFRKINYQREQDPPTGYNYNGFPVNDQPRRSPGVGLPTQIPFPYPYHYQRPPSSGNYQLQKQAPVSTDGAKSGNKASASSVDSELRDLVADTDYLAFQDAYEELPEGQVQGNDSHYAETALPPDTYQPQIYQNYSSQYPPPTMGMSPIHLSQPPIAQQYLMFPQQFQQNSPVFDFQPHMNYSYIQPNHPGQFYPVNEGIQDNTHVKKKKSFYRVQVPSAYHTTSKQLHLSHTELMDNVSLTSLIDQTTSSRYGDVDTTSFILNSANNSRSGSRAGSLPSRPNSNSIRNISIKMDVDSHQPHDGVPNAGDSDHSQFSNIQDVNRVPSKLSKVQDI